jgi:hypothetical protein
MLGKNVPPGEQLSATSTEPFGADYVVPGEG